MRIKHVFNYILESGRLRNGKVILAKAAIMEDSNKNLHFVMLCPKEIVDSGADPQTYLQSELRGISSCG
ncbi:MAG: hypothetical protein KGH67_05735 [Candidatus Micrarchaeota archaeon]|nr:hypothetical protein [Candidatus Micrarchaeota archaeon]MDE1859996.1 hypothetical protein [Candidatus Micrarchaeota archaeon]